MRGEEWAGIPVITLEISQTDVLRFIIKTYKHMVKVQLGHAVL